MKFKVLNLRRSMLVAACSLVLIAGGCSSVPKPVGQMASASTAISSAETSGAKQYSPVELGRAMTKLQQAKNEANKKNYEEATRFAEESLADANLARAKADAGKTQKAANEMEDSINLLRKSLNLD